MLTTIQKLLLAFITLIVGLVLVGSVATSSNTVTTIKAVGSGPTTFAGGAPSWTGTHINATKVYTIVNAPTGWKAYDCPITNFRLTNSSGTALTSATDYVFTASTGTYTMKDTVNTNTTSLIADNVTLVSYNYCGDDYLNSDWQRTVLALTPGFFALALLIFSVGMFYSLARDAGIV
jgi:hypothetical protein